MIKNVLVLGMLACFFIFMGCTPAPERERQVGFSEFPETVTLGPNPVQGAYKLLNPRGLAYMDGKLFIREAKSNYPLRVYDINTQSYDTVHLSKGRGPRQISGMMYLKAYGGQVHAMDVVTSTLYDFELQADLTVDMYKTGFDAVMAGDYYQFEHNLYFLAAFEEGRIGRYNTQSENTSVLGQTPEGTDGFVYNYIHDGYMVLSPDGKKVAIAQLYTDLLEIYDTTGNRLAQVQGPLQTPVEYRTVNGRNVRFSAENHHGYLGVFATQNQIIGLFSGMPVTQPDAFIKAVHIFSWDGKPCKRYELKKPLLCAAFDPGSSVLYGVSAGNELQFVRYNVLP